MASLLFSSLVLGVGILVVFIVMAAWYLIPLKIQQKFKRQGLDAPPPPSLSSGNLSEMKRMKMVHDESSFRDGFFRYYTKNIFPYFYQRRKAYGSDKSKPDPTDRKGKKPAESHNRFTRAKFLCQICMERGPATQSFHINPCNHIFCNSCIVNYITSKLDGSNATIPCPHPGCKSGFLDPLTCRRILPVDTFDKWGLVLCESSLGGNKFYCPFKDCSALLVDDGGEEVRNCKCPHCNRMFCAKCKEPWHGGMNCKKFQRLGKNEMGEEDLMLRKLAKDKRWQRCPRCRIYVEKIDGCMFMKCRCGYCFCYVCATPIVEKNSLLHQVQTLT